MSRILTAALIVCPVLAAAACAAAGIPDPEFSHVDLSNEGKGLTSCPLGDGPTFEYITVTAVRADGSPIMGIPSPSFFFTVTGTGAGNCVIAAFDSETDALGKIRFTAHASNTIPHGQLEIRVQIYTVVLYDVDYLTCNSFDYDESGTVAPIDFAYFAADFNTTDERSDFDWDGVVTPVDFGRFADHFGPPPH